MRRPTGTAFLVRHLTVVTRTSELMERFIVSLTGECGIFGQSTGLLHSDILPRVTVMLMHWVHHLCLLV